MFYVFNWLQVRRRDLQPSFMSGVFMTVPPVMLKPGVLFLETFSGGVLMDVAADRFLALSPVSATVWGNLAMGRTLPEVVDTIAAVRAVAHDHAEALVTSQLRSWERAELINTRQLPIGLPQPKSSSLLSSRELSIDAIRSAPLVPRLIASLYIADRKYRRALAKVGLASTLKSFQLERGRLARPPEVIIRRTLRIYYALRRSFRQGQDARDCLFRSLALAAVLKRQGVDAQLCIGIIDMPFSSHAWVESGDYVLNETVRECSRYTVIGRF
jgi:hypothetical protein